VIDIGRLVILLNQTKLNKDNPALFQLLSQILSNSQQTNETINNVISGGDSGGGISGPSVSLDNQIVLFDGLTGKKIKGATGSGVVHAISGVYSASAVVETDQSLSNVTTLNVNTSRHGYAPILPNDATKFLDGTGNYTAPTGTNPDYVVLSDGANPPTPIDDGAGNFIYVAYTP